MPHVVKLSISATGFDKPVISLQRGDLLLVKTAAGDEGHGERLVPFFTRSVEPIPSPEVKKSEQIEESQAAHALLKLDHLVRSTEGRLARGKNAPGIHWLHLPAAAGNNHCGFN